MRGKMEPERESGVGSLLKSEREKKGISIDQLASATKLRKHFIEALEDEAWHNLPSPVYVKGFIRSYARGAGFDGKEAIRLYESIAPVEEEIPRPLREVRVPKSRPAIFFVFLIIILAAIIYLLAGKKPQIFQDRGDDILVREEQQEEIKPAVEQEPEQVEPEVDLGLPEVQFEEVQPEASDPEYLSAEEGPSNIPEEDVPIVHQAEPVPVPIDEPSFSQAIDNYVLTGIVNLRTYIKIYVDENQPKEYIFQPGSRPQWTAREGFDILVGNAAGVEFEFNGKRIKDLGALGKVVRVKLPEDFESKFYEALREIN
jgi:cytoskeletal protein RodZ